LRILGAFHPDRPIPNFLEIERSSHALRRHLDVFLFSSAAKGFSKSVDYITSHPKAPRLSCLTLQHVKKRRHLFIRNRLISAPKDFAFSFGRATFRVWLPSSWFSLSISLKASFSLQHSWVSPSRALLLLDDGPWLFPTRVPLLCFSKKPFKALFLYFMGWLPPRKPYPTSLCAPSF